jgi:NDP-sugar pyrophosphorylase family protein
MASFPAVILAAGQSSRFWPLNSEHKSLIKIAGRPLIWYTIHGLADGGIKTIIIVQGAKKDVERCLARYRFKGVTIRYVVQKESKGMGNALWLTKGLLKTPFLVVNAERVDIKDIIQIPELKAHQNGSNFKSILFLQKTKNAHLFGMVQLRGRRIVGIVEKPKKGKEPSQMKVVGVYFLSPKFFDYYKRIPKHRYDFEDTISLYAKDNFVFAHVLQKGEEDTPTLKYPWHLLRMRDYLFDRFLETSISKTAKLSRGVVIEGKVSIGANTRILENAVVRGPVYIGDNCVIGNNALVREYTNLEDGVVIGANAEVTRCVFQENVHVHSGFFGDSIFGKGCRIGAGVITANRRFDRGTIRSQVGGEKIDTGLHSFGSVIGREASVGIHAGLMPGVLIGQGSCVGPHSMVKENIPDHMLFYSRWKAYKRTFRERRDDERSAA